jgi:ABC-type transporter Mla MlaB component
VAFSLFGKKPTVPAPTAKVPKTAARAEEKPAPPDDDELVSLDFTHPGDMPASKREERIQVQQVAQQVPAVIEQAAMLYSAEQTALACDALQAAIRDEDLGRFTQRAWGMLFDLYQELGHQQDFEALAFEYAAKFETSPPAWTAHRPEARETAAAGAGRSSIALAGTLDLKAQEPLKQLLKFAEKNPTVRLDLAKLADADDSGCALLNSVLRQLKKQRKECALAGADKLAAILAKKTASGKRERENTWLLLLELYQHLFDQNAFEEAAVNYAVTFEVSPPSWEPPKAKPGKAGSERQPATAAEGCALEGNIIAGDESAFAALRVQAETRDDIVVDVSRLRRMDFVAAANLMNVVTALVSARKTVRFVKASHLLTALWEVIGLDRVARIETRKT